MGKAYTMTYVIDNVRSVVDDKSEREYYNKHERKEDKKASKEDFIRASYPVIEFIYNLDEEITKADKIKFNEDKTHSELSKYILRCFYRDEINMRIDWDEVYGNGTTTTCENTPTEENNDNFENEDMVIFELQ